MAKVDIVKVEGGLLCVLEMMQKVSYGEEISDDHWKRYLSY